MMADPLAGLGNIFAFDPMAFAGGWVMMVNTIVIIIFLGVFGFFAWHFRLFVKFPVDVDIFRMMSGNLQQVDNDKARRVKKKKTGEVYYEFKKRRIKWKPPTFDVLTSAAGKKKYKLYLKELSQDNFEVINPRTFVTSSAAEFRRVENEELDRFYKNTEDMKAQQKWSKEDKWKKIMEIVPVVIIVILAVVLLSVGIDSYVKIVQSSNVAAGQLQHALEMSTALLNKSIEYMDRFGPMTVYENGTAVIR